MIFNTVRSISFLTVWFPSQKVAAVCKHNNWSSTHQAPCGRLEDAAKASGWPLDILVDPTKSGSPQKVPKRAKMPRQTEIHPNCKNCFLNLRDLRFRMMKRCFFLGHFAASNEGRVVWGFGVMPLPTMPRQGRRVDSVVEFLDFLCPSAELQFGEWRLRFFCQIETSHMPIYLFANIFWLLNITLSIIWATNIHVREFFWLLCWSVELLATCCRFWCSQRCVKNLRSRKSLRWRDVHPQWRLDYKKRCFYGQLFRS